ncbi:MAG: tRNA (N(6)-L-threonylcarbamoyladenosine(37)-C(2))-methylthiotransferase MtaB [Pseudomonadota bacterium]
MQALPAYLPKFEPKPRLRVRTYTFGCKVNLADTVSIESDLERHSGVSILRDEKEPPDVVIVNTCTVTSSADRQARQFLRKIHRKHPDSRIVVTGCYAQADPKTLEGIEGVNSVIPIRDHYAIPAFLGLRRATGEETAPTSHFAGRTRAFLKMQDGCNAYCSFCILPFIRGRSRSVPLEELTKQAKAFEHAGFREIVLTGTHMGAFGRDLRPRVRISDALREIVGTIPGLAIRVSSLEPAALTPDLIRAVKELPEIRPHFHVPLQSGSDRVLQRMNRKYRVERYAERVQALVQTRPRMGLGADVMVGFPGETGVDFEQTVEWIEKLPITFLHVFRFSARPGTRAATLDGAVSDADKYGRMKRLIDLGERKRRAFQASFIGSVQPVLVEKKRDEKGCLTGYTPHYVPVRLEGPDRLMENEIDVRLNRSEGETLVGEAV